MARAARKALADMRALEEQAERVNPVGRTRKAAPKRRGRGAVPSSGLSQFRGGADDMDEGEEEMDLIAEMPSGEYDGGAKHTLMDHLKNPLKGFGAYLHELEGGLQTGAYEGEGQTGGRLGRTRKAAPASEEPKEAPAVGGRKKRAPAGPEDGRRKRAAIVKKVMAEKGCSMIEASRIVKEKGLYKP